MLSKLFKHEMRACSRMLLPLYLVLIVFTLLDRIFVHLDVFKGIGVLVQGLITFIYILSITAVVVVSFVIIIMRFYKNLTTDEGYLMFTLPVKASELINSKLIVAIIWTLLSAVGVLASIFAVIVTPVIFQNMKDGWADCMQEMHNYFGAYSTLFIIELIIIFLVAVLESILHIYASVALGQLVNGHKLIGSFAAYVVLYIVTQVIGFIAMAVGELVFHFNNTQPDAKTVVLILLPILFIFILVFTAGFYLTTNILFKKKLNLE